MRVVATAPGYLGHYRETGEEFDVPEGAKASWFTPVKRGKAEETGEEFDVPEGAKASGFTPVKRGKAKAEKTEETGEALV